MLKVHSIETLGTHEGPGIRYVIFLQGCNYRCLYCHNPDTQDLTGGNEISTEELLDNIEKMRPYFGEQGGITVSGGEPLVQTKDLIDFFQAAKKSGFHTALDTNGSVLNNDTKKLLESTDLVLLDIKQINNTWHKKITGSPNDTPLAFAQYLEKNKKPFWIRYVLMPGYTDQEELLKKLGKHFKGYRFIQRLEILPYHAFGIQKYEQLGWEYKCKSVPVPTVEQIEQAKKILKKYFKRVYVR